MIRDFSSHLVFPGSRRISGLVEGSPADASHPGGYKPQLEIGSDCPQDPNAKPFFLLVFFFFEKMLFSNAKLIVICLRLSAKTFWKTVFSICEGEPNQSPSKCQPVNSRRKRLHSQQKLGEQQKKLKEARHLSAAIFFLFQFLPTKSGLASIPALPNMEQYMTSTNPSTLYLARRGRPFGGNRRIHRRGAHRGVWLFFTFFYKLTVTLRMNVQVLHLTSNFFCTSH